ncbi:hypothetical protein LZ32DRAFT_71404 [Colletotrichum eremochloae]|nr:hypothetical protein LZ32DRAFT_71404 [Colletotrichum eremochloae]
MNAITGGTDLISCSNVTGIGTSYCCDHAANCCNSGVGRFDILPPEPQVWATWNRESTRFVVVLQTSSERSSSTSAFPAATSSGMTLTSASSVLSALEPVIPSPTRGHVLTSMEPTAKPGTTQDNTSEGPGLSTAAKAGIGAGAGAGVVLLVVIVFLLRKVRSQKKALQSHHAWQESHRWPGMYQEPQMQCAYYSNGQPERWAPPRAREDEAPLALNGSYEMDAQPTKQHWARIELPANI